MRRSGYVIIDDPLELGRWRGMVASAIRGKRGQAFLRRLIAALDAMPWKGLIADKLGDEYGRICAVGAALKAAGQNLSNWEPYDHEGLGAALNIHACLVKEVEALNDFEGGPVRPWDLAEYRWARMRYWAEEHLRKKSQT